MTVQYWGEVITNSLQTLWSGFIGFLPSFLGAIIVFIIGWLIAIALGKLAAQIIRALKIDDVLAKTGLGEKLARANMKLDSGKFIGGLVKWFFIIVFLMAAVDIIGLGEVTDFLKQVLLYIPRLIVAVLILLVAVLVASFFEKIVKASVETAGLRASGFLAKIARWAVLIFGFLAALIQLGVVPNLINTLFTGVVVALAIALGLAFGLGGRDLAARLLEKWEKDISSK